MSSSLPSGYQKLTDPNSGRPYYVNLVTGQTNWTPPAEETNHLQKSGSLPAGWEERVDPTTGRTFYIDHVNKKTTWEHPGQPAAAPRPSAYEEPSRSHRQPASKSQSGSQSVSTLERDAQLARELAAQWDLESEPSAKNESDADAITSGTTLKDWAKDDDTTHCFLTGTKFTVVNRKHHCRYCGQIFASEVCKRTAKIPQLGYVEPVRVCDVCADQLESGDPVCICKQVALLRSSSESARQQGARALTNWAAMDPQFGAAPVVAALEALKLPELIASLMRTAAPATQTAVAQLLAAIHSHSEHRAPFKSVDLLEPLLSSVRNANADAAASAMSTLATLCAASESARNQLRAANGLAALLDVLLSAPSEQTTNATCQVLVSLCEDQTDDWKLLLNNGAIFPLVSALGSANAELQAHLARMRTRMAHTHVRIVSPSHVRLNASTHVYSTCLPLPASPPAPISPAPLLPAPRLLRCQASTHGVDAGLAQGDGLAWQPIPSLSTPGTTPAGQPSPSLSTPGTTPAGQPSSSLSTPGTTPAGQPSPSLSTPGTTPAGQASPSLSTPGTTPAGQPSPSLSTPGTTPAGQASPSLSTPGTTPAGQASPSLSTPGTPAGQPGPSLSTPGTTPAGQASPSLSTPGTTPAGQASPSLSTPGTTPAGQASPSLSTPGTTPAGQASPSLFTTPAAHPSPAWQPLPLPILSPRPAAHDACTNEHAALHLKSLIVVC